MSSKIREIIGEENAEIKLMKNRRLMEIDFLGPGMPGHYIGIMHNADYSVKYECLQKVELYPAGIFIS